MLARAPTTIPTAEGDMLTFGRDSNPQRVRPLPATDFITLADADHTTGLQAWLDASADGTPLHLSAGEYRVSSVLLSENRTRPLIITGDGSDLVTIKRLDGTVTGSGGMNRMMSVTNRAGRTVPVYVRGITFDHNATGNPFGDGEGGFDWEQSAALHLGPSGVRGIRFTGRDLRCLDPVADFLNLAGSGVNTFGRIVLSDLAVPARSRDRFDLTVTASYDSISMTDCALTSVRFEQNGTNYDQHHDLLMRRVTITHDNDTNFSNSVGHEGTSFATFQRKPVHTLTDCHLTGRLQFDGAITTVTDSILVLTNSARILTGDLTMTGCALQATGTALDYATGDGIIYSSGDVYVYRRATFEACQFTAAAGLSARWFNLGNTTDADGGLTLSGCTVGGDFGMRVRDAAHVFANTSFTGVPADGVYVLVGTPLAHPTSLAFTDCTFADPTAPWSVPDGVAVTQP